MGGAKRYPSIAVCGEDGFREGLNPSYALASNYFADDNSVREGRLAQSRIVTDLNIWKSLET
jgi:hypothetical protein